MYTKIKHTIFAHKNSKKKFDKYKVVQKQTYRTFHKSSCIVPTNPPPHLRSFYVFSCSAGVRQKYTHRL